MKDIRLLSALLISATIAAVGAGYRLLDRGRIASATNVGDTKRGNDATFANAVPLRPSFTVEKPTKLTLASGLGCNDATNATNAFTAYDRVRTALAEGAEPATVEYLECFLSADETDAAPDVVLKRFIGKVFEPNVLYSYLDAAFDKVLYKTVQQGNLRGGLLAWASNYLGEAALLGYERTGEKRFVALYLDYFDKLMELRDSVLNIRDDYHDKVMDSWGSANLGRNSVDADVWVAHVTHFSVVSQFEFCRD